MSRGQLMPAANLCRVAVEIVFSGHFKLSCRNCLYDGSSNFYFDNYRTVNVTWNTLNTSRAGDYNLHHVCAYVRGSRSFL